jgi:hypothetical protein
MREGNQFAAVAAMHPLADACLELVDRPKDLVDPANRFDASP